MKCDKYYYIEIIINKLLYLINYFSIINYYMNRVSKNFEYING